jgi:hypothetical protein
MTRKRLFAGFAVVAGLLVLTWVILAGLAALATRRAERAWAAAWLSLDDFERRFPAVSTNADARRLEELAACVGVDFARRTEGEPPRAAGGCAGELAAPFGRHKAVRGALAQHQREQLARVDDRLDPPPPDVAAWLAAQRANLAAVRDHLRASEPRWRLDVSLGYQAPVPSLLAVLNLQRALNAAAGEAQRQGRPDEAAAFFDASLALDAALADRPDLISQLISGAAACLQAGLLRRLDPPPLCRAARLGEHDRWRSFLTAIEGEGWVRLHGEPAGGLTPAQEASAARRFGLAVGSPFVRLSVAGVSERLAAAVGALAVQDACADPPPAVTADPEELFPRWNTLARVAWPHLADASRRIARVRLDIELAGQVVALREARARDGRWPSTGEGLPSALCPGERWLVRALPDGGLELSFSRDLPAGTGPVLELPLSCTLSPSPPAR